MFLQLQAGEVDSTVQGRDCGVPIFIGWGEKKNFRGGGKSEEQGGRWGYGGETFEKMAGKGDHLVKNSKKMTM